VATTVDLYGNLETNDLVRGMLKAVTSGRVMSEAGL
jgi:hypothetical protein